MVTIGVDIGGTKIAAGAVDDHGKIIDRVIRDTPGTDSDSVVVTIIEVVRKLQQEHEVEAVGVAPAGFVSSDRSQMLFSPNLALTGVAIRERVMKDVGCAVVVENDANAAGWAEYRFGAGRDTKNMVMLTIGTGLGGAVIANNDLIRGAFGVAGELGHLRLVPDGRACNCGQFGCWERYASGTALEQNAQSGAVSHVERAEALLERAGGDPHKITGPDVTYLARKGDEYSRELVATLGRWIGEGIAMVASILDPGQVVVGGGVSAAGELLLQPARIRYDELLSARSERPRLEICEATMGNDAGIVGAADLARQ